MLLGFLAAIAVALFAACIAFIVKRTLGLNARWLIPAAAGSALIGFTLWNDYTWFSRQKEGLPESVVVTDSYERSMGLMPWSLVVPITIRYRALDRATLVPVDGAEGVVMARVYLVERWRPTYETLQLFDCAQGRRADAPLAVEPGGAIDDTEWVDLPEGHPLLSAACAVA